MKKLVSIIGKIIDYVFVGISFLLTFWAYPFYLATAFFWKWTFEGNEKNHVDSKSILKPNFKTVERFFVMLWSMFILNVLIELIINSIQ